MAARQTKPVGPDPTIDVRLGERVSHLESQIEGQGDMLRRIETDIAEKFRSLENAIGSMRTERQDERHRIHGPITAYLGIVLMIAGPTIGFLFHDIRTDTTANAQHIATLGSQQQAARLAEERRFTRLETINELALYGKLESSSEPIPGLGAAISRR